MVVLHVCQNSERDAGGCVGQKLQFQRDVIKSKCILHGLSTESTFSSSQTVLENIDRLWRASNDFVVEIHF